MVAQETLLGKTSYYPMPLFCFLSGVNSNSCAFKEALRLFLFCANRLSFSCFCSHFIVLDSQPSRAVALDWDLPSGGLGINICIRFTLFRVVPSESHIETSYLGPVLHGEQMKSHGHVDTSHPSSPSSVRQRRMHLMYAIGSNVAKGIIYSLIRQWRVKTRSVINHAVSAETESLSSFEAS